MRKLAVVACLTLTFLRGEQQAVIEIDTGKVEHAIPRTIYGSFLEPIGHSIYGGLWAQLLENPSLEENMWSAGRIVQMLAQKPELTQSSGLGLPLPWEPLDASQGARYEPRWGNAANSARSLLIMALPGIETGIRQEVYLPVHRVLRFEGSLYAKPVSGNRDLTVSLRRRDHKADVFTAQKLHLISEAWQQYKFVLDVPRTALATREPADFVVSLSDDARMLVDQVVLFPADNVEGMNPEMLEMARAMKSPIVRFGGNFTSGYHFRDGLGPMDKRVSMLNQSWGMPEYNHFGTDEFLSFCRLVGTQPQIALNLGSGSPEEAADWVRYVNGKWGKKGLLWELGNELWGTFQIGYPTVSKIASLTKTFSAAIRAADPEARLIATGADPDRFHDWNATQLQLGPAAFNYLSTHFVVRTADVLKTNASREFVAQAALALPVGLETQLRSMKKQIDADPTTRNRIGIAFTEWLFAGPAGQAPMYDNLGGALAAAGFLNMLMRVSDFTTISDMTGNIEFGGIWQKRGRVYGVPAYWAFRMYSNADGTKLVRTNVKVDHYDIEDGVRRIPSIHAVPFLDVVSTLNEAGNKLTLFCVNRNLEQDIHGTIRLKDFAAGPAHAEELTASSLYAGNDEVRPDAISPAAKAVSTRGENFEYVFPRMSVTVIEVARAR
ncbi:MAG: hypothetical protein M3Z09_03420 [Acidobacteriota bacterium]|nr:hypothetical protein [Acidobacteriota bacterium]